MASDPSRWSDLRPIVRKMALAMERKLRKHDGVRGSSGWRTDSADDLFTHLLEEVAELHREVVRGLKCLDEAADVAALRAENERLKKRLEIDVVYELQPDGTVKPKPAGQGTPDGIECRDATIAHLEADNERLRAALEECRAWWLGRIEDGSLPHDEECETTVTGGECDCPARLIIPLLEADDAK